MSCYKDRSFCSSAPHCEKSNKCGHLLTDADKRKANAANLPISWIEKCERFKEKKERKK